MPQAPKRGQDRTVKSNPVQVAGSVAGPRRRSLASPRHRARTENAESMEKFIPPRRPRSTRMDANEDEDWNHGGHGIPYDGYPRPVDLNGRVAVPAKRRRMWTSAVHSKNGVACGQAACQFATDDGPLTTTYLGSGDILTSSTQSLPVAPLSPTRTIISRADLGTVIVFEERSQSASAVQGPTPLVSTSFRRLS